MPPSWQLSQKILDAAEELGIRARTMLHASEFIEMFEYQLRVVPGLSDCWNGFPPNPEIRAWHKVQCRGGVSLAKWNPETQSWTLFVLDPEPARHFLPA